MYNVSPAGVLLYRPNVLTPPIPLTLENAPEQAYAAVQAAHRDYIHKLNRVFCPAFTPPRIITRTAAGFQVKYREPRRGEHVARRTFPTLAEARAWDGDGLAAQWLECGLPVIFSARGWRERKIRMTRSVNRFLTKSSVMRRARWAGVTHPAFAFVQKGDYDAAVQALYASRLLTDDHLTAWDNTKARHLD